MKLRIWILCLTLASCGDDTTTDTGPSDSGAVDASAGDTSTTDVGLDAGELTPDVFVSRPPPECAPLPPVTPPECGSGPVARNALIPGPAREGHDEALAREARIFDRTFHAIANITTGANTEVDVSNADDRTLIERFLRDDDGWDISEFAGRPAEDFLSWRKVAGAYGGVGFAADAFRYAVLRDEGAACDEVERARGHVLASLDAAHRALSLTGVRGVIARGYQRSDVPTSAHETVPLFDEEGNPLPEEKNNGTWREDESGEAPEYQWEDSCSRDMLIGWVFGMAALHEVIALDPTIDESVKARLRDDALAIANNLMRVGEAGRDLEVLDADGRVTFHGYLHEDAIDRVYIDSFASNSQHAVMALGIMSALAHVSEDADVSSYVYNELVRRRRLHLLVERAVGVVSVGVATNYSNYNMAFTGGWLASRYLCDDDAREAVTDGVRTELYGDAEGREPAAFRQSFYDLVVASAAAGARVGVDGTAASIEEDVVEGAVNSLRAFPTSPHWNTPRENCDVAEIEALRCLAVDGVTELTLLERRARGGHVVADAPLPFSVRPPSNYYWRSDPHRVNSEGNEATLLPGVDFRIAYWMGRYIRVR